MHSMNNSIISQDDKSPLVGSTSSVRPLKVLVVEDDAAMLRLYQTVLPAWPLLLDAACVNNGIDAMFKMRRMQPDLLILDLKIPGIDGMKVLKETMWQAGVTTVVVTGLDEDRIHHLGGIPFGVEVLSKPVPFPRLMAIARKISAAKCATLEPVNV
jgi:two-component system response regulator YesN